MSRLELAGRLESRPGPASRRRTPPHAGMVLAKVDVHGGGGREGQSASPLILVQTFNTLPIFIPPGRILIG